ncbi:MAG: glycosyl hydrolase family 28 protein [Opitutaceae bacterium]|nr:glycosyl hydrolase family 28 protein [Opitutaceae bacterium]
MEHAQGDHQAGIGGHADRFAQEGAGGQTVGFNLGGDQNSPALDKVLVPGAQVACQPRCGKRDHREHGDHDQESRMDSGVLGDRTIHAVFMILLPSIQGFLQSSPSQASRPHRCNRATNSGCPHSPNGFLQIPVWPRMSIPWFDLSREMRKERRWMLAEKLVPALACILAFSVGADAEIVVYPAPPGETPSSDYRVTVNGRAIHVYTAQTLNGGPASFAYFDFSGKVTVTVTPDRAFTSAMIRPASFGIIPSIDKQELRFELSRPRNLTIELDGGTDRVLHLFANPLEQDPLRPDDPNVTYFGPGVHEIGTAKLTSGQTLYIAGGAVVRPVIRPEDKPTVERNWAGNKEYDNLLTAEGASNVTIRGRGILDLSRLPWHARTAFMISDCDHVLVEGIVILVAPPWVVAVFDSRNVTVRNIKQICRRENSDGVDLCNTQDALVEDCFLRNNDDEVCVKTTSPAPAPESRNIVVRRCVIWNERARGLGITSETRRNITHVVFRDCDIIHDFSNGGDCAALAVLVSDSGTMSDIRFEDIRVEDVRNTLINGWIGADMWGHDNERGHVNGVLFRDITAAGERFPGSRLAGCDPAHLFENVTFENVRINEQAVTSLATGHIQANEHVKDIKFAGSRVPDPPSRREPLTGESGFAPP